MLLFDQLLESQNLWWEIFIYEFWCLCFGKASSNEEFQTFPAPPFLVISHPSLSPCSALRSTGELYLICDTIILRCSLHLISQKWYCSGMRKSLASSGACPCVQSEGRHYMRMHQMEHMPLCAQNEENKHFEQHIVFLHGQQPHPENRPT